MKPIPMEWREKIVSAYDEGQTMAEVAERFDVSVDSVLNFVKLKRETGSLEPKPHGGGRQPRIEGEDAERLEEIVAESPDATLEELAEKLGIDVDPSVMHRTLERLGITRKKKVSHASERDSGPVQKKRAEWKREAADIDPNRYVFIDQMGVNTKMARRYGRAPRGERVVGTVPHKHWNSLTVLSGMRLDGSTPTMIYEGGTKTDRMVTFVEERLETTLSEGDIVVADNLAAHTSKRFREAVEACGAEVRLLPTYSPDLNPIERMWSKVKTVLRKQATRAVDALRTAAHNAIATITKSDIRNWVRHSGCYL